jgi:hypothetical protein
MPTKKFGGGSVRSIEDFYENKVEPDFKAVVESQAVTVEKTPKAPFHYYVKTEVNSVLPLKAVVNQLREIAGFLEEQTLVSAVGFSLNVDEVVKK